MTVTQSLLVVSPLLLALAAFIFDLLRENPRRPKAITSTKRTAMQYQVKDPEGNVVAEFETQTEGPFTVVEKVSDPQGGGGPGEEQG